MIGSTVFRTGGIALAVGLDVLALSTGIGVLGVPWSVRIRVGAAFATAEILMQVLGTVIGAGVGHVAGEVAAYVGNNAERGAGCVLIALAILFTIEHLGH